MARVVILRQEGSDEPHGIGHVDGLESMQAIVGGYIECVQITELLDGRTLDLWTNEEGNFDSSLSTNRIATIMCPEDVLLGPNGIMGDTFVCCSKDGECVDINPEMERLLQTIVLSTGGLWAKPAEAHGLG